MTRGDAFWQQSRSVLCHCLSPCHSGLKLEGLKHGFWRKKAQRARLPNTGPLESPQPNRPREPSEGERGMRLTASCAVLHIHHRHRRTQNSSLVRRQLCERRSQWTGVASLGHGKTFCLSTHLFPSRDRACLASAHRRREGMRALHHTSSFQHLLSLFVCFVLVCFVSPP